MCFLYFLVAFMFNAKHKNNAQIALLLKCAIEIISHCHALIAHYFYCNLHLPSVKQSK